MTDKVVKLSNHLEDPEVREIRNKLLEFDVPHRVIEYLSKEELEFLIGELEDPEVSIFSDFNDEEDIAKVVKMIKEFKQNN